MNAKELWGRVTDALALRWAKSDCETWLRGTRISRFDNGWLEITTPNAVAARWLQEHVSDIEKELTKILKYSLAGVRFVTTHSLSDAAANQRSSPPLEEERENEEEDSESTFQLVAGWQPRRAVEKLPDIVWQRTEERVLHVDDVVFFYLLLYLWQGGDVMFHVRGFLAECLGTTEKHIRGMESRLCRSHGFSSGNPLLGVQRGVPRKGHGTGYTVYSAFKPCSPLDHRDEWKFGHYDNVAHGFLLPYLRGKFHRSRQSIVPFFMPNSGPCLSLPAGGLYLYLLHLSKVMRIPRSVEPLNRVGNEPCRQQQSVCCSVRHLLKKLGADFHKEPRRSAWTELDRLGWIRSSATRERAEDASTTTVVINDPPTTLLEQIGLAVAVFQEEDTEPFMKKWELAINKELQENNSNRHKGSRGNVLQWVVDQVEDLGWRLTNDGKAAIAADIEAMRKAF